MSRQTFIRYTKAEPEYFAIRSLRQQANWFLLWGLGVGAAIASNVFGWNLALQYVEFWQMASAIFLMAVMNICLAYSIAELSSSWPYAGGFYSFGRHTFGPVGGFICGTIITIVYVLMPMLIVMAMTEHLGILAPDVPRYVWWLLGYSIAIALNIFGAKVALRIGLLFTVLTLLVLFSFYIGVYTTSELNFNPINSFNYYTSDFSIYSIIFVLTGIPGIFAVFSLALWFFIAIEEVPVAAEETRDAANAIPKALVRGTFTLILLSFLTLFFGSGYNLKGVDTSATPLLDGFKVILSQQPLSPQAVNILLVPLALVGLLASLHALTFIYARQLFSLSRAGYFPRWLSVTNRYQVPHRALIFGALIGLLALWFAQRTGYTNLDMLLFDTTTVGAMLSYIIVSASYIKFKLEHPESPRPYQSPLGIGGAATSGTLAFIVLMTYLRQFNSPITVIGLFAPLVVLILYFLFYSRTRLVRQAPEERSDLAKATDHLSLTARQQQIFKSGLLVLFTLFALFLLRDLYYGSLDCAPDCIGKNFIGRNLSNMTLTDVKLIEANLRRANFADTELVRADLSGAKLIGANFEGANLSEAKLIGADLTNANFSGATLNEANLSGAKLKGANFTDVNLTETILRGVDFSGARLIGTDLSGVELAGVDFSSAQLKGANLSNTRLAGATLSFADLSGANLLGSDLTGALINRANLTGVNIYNGRMYGVTVVGTNMSASRMRCARIVGSIMIGVNLNGADLSNADLRGVRTKKAQFTDSVKNSDTALVALSDDQQKKIVVDTNTKGAISNDNTKWPTEKNEEKEIEFDVMIMNCK